MVELNSPCRCRIRYQHAESSSLDVSGAERMPSDSKKQQLIAFPQRVHTSYTMPIKPITGMLRRGLVLDLSVAFGLGTSFGYAFWYGYHVPAVAARDKYYSKLEDRRAANAAA
ncbi:hypothetical protein VTL71DRAFT_12546 [Oculimacula yallundae]|uniref:Cytochrome c oxidase polypeptide VIIA n=1 Tax=Oculimacula yallundae TaxID=86028 RepID=A0ABR4CQ31_9HELO